MSRHPTFISLGSARRANVLLAATAAFALGLAIGAAFRPAAAPGGATTIEPFQDAASGGELSRLVAPIPQKLGPQAVYPAEVMRVIDGDTFEARVRVWPGLDVDTKVRLRGIDAAELHARCSDELAQAQAARAALITILDEGGVTIWRVGIDKYGGRVDALAATRNTADVSAAMLTGGWARSYDGGRRGTWCG
jgi:endonuclease YncB( thermonuclease family)